MQILREWRGGIHLVATTAVGLSPLEAILTNEGPGQAKFFGWPEPFPDFGPISSGTTRPRTSPTASARQRWPTRSTRRNTRTSEPGSRRSAPPPRRALRGSPPGRAEPGRG